MSRKIIESLNADREMLNTNTWPSVNIFALSKEKQEIFNKRKTAIELYMKDRVKVAEIVEITGIDKKSLCRLVKRCFEFDEEGQIWGFRALIPKKRIIEYKRKDDLDIINSNKDDKKIGAFALLLDSYPEIKEKITDLYFNKNKDELAEPIIKGKYLHKKFIDACRTAGIKVNEYPFTTKDLARRSLYRYLKKLEIIYYTDAAKRNGEDAARRMKSTGIGEKNRPVITRPYARVEFDGHKIDGVFVITFATPEGDVVSEVLNRIWILVILDVATRSTLGYHVSLNKEYNSNDVLQCVRNAIVPKKLMEFTIPGFKYADNTGFASLAIPETEWALWEEFCYDNGKANLSGIVRNRLENIVGCTVNPGPVKMPERRSIIERFFGLLEENGFHRLPNTTGSNPKDPRRKNEEEIAKKYEISYEDLVQLVEMLIANYNNEPHAGIYYLSPLECMEQRISRGMKPRVMPEENRDEIAFLTCQVNRTVSGSIKKGKRPFIYFEGVEYRNEVLSRSPELIGTKLDLLVNVDDIRVLKAFLPDGSEYGYLTASGKWGVIPHSLQIRKQINRLREKKLIHITNSDDPIEIYKTYLQNEALNKKDPRNRLASINRMQKEYENKVETAIQNSTEDDTYKNDNQDNSSIQFENSNSTQEEMKEFRSKFKTITY